MKKAILLSKLQNAISTEEWVQLKESQSITISQFNRRTLLEMMELTAAEDRDQLADEKIEGLYFSLRQYLEKYFPEKPEAWKWIILASIYLTFLAEKPMHPIEIVGIQVRENGSELQYECPEKSSEPDAVCNYCVCKKMSNYDIMKIRMQKEFLKYDQDAMIQKFQLGYDEDFLYTELYSHKYSINRKNGKVMLLKDGFDTDITAELGHAISGFGCATAELGDTASEARYITSELEQTVASYEEAMTLYDILCSSSKDCHPSGQYVNMMSLSSIKGGSMSLGTGLFHKKEKAFDQKEKELHEACLRLKGIRYGKGDVAYKIPMFGGMNVIFQFWNSDEEFPASLQILVDKNILQYMKYETMWFAISHLMNCLGEF